MRFVLIIIIFDLFLIVGCNNAQQKYQTFFDPEYEVIDRGAFDVKVVSRACSVTFEEALLAAKKNGRFQLRSIVGHKSHGVNFKEINSYTKQNKICVEMSASSFVP